LAERQDLSGVHVEEPLVRGLRAFDEFGIRTVGRVDEADVVVLAVESAEDRLVAPREPVGAEAVDAMRPTSGRETPNLSAVCLKQIKLT
jgi:hypothetical protein